MGKIYGYCRVSSKEQNTDRQLTAMLEAKVPQKNIYVDKQSGKDFKRPAYRRLVRRLKEGDLLCIKSIDRLGRNYDEIIEQWKMLTKEKGVDVFVIDIPILDTRKGKDLLGTLIADLVLTLLSYVAQNERECIRQRQAEGIVEARRRGVRFGRPKAVLPDSFQEARRSWRCGDMSLPMAAKACGMAQTTFYKYAK